MKGNIPKFRSVKWVPFCTTFNCQPIKPTMIPTSSKIVGVKRVWERGLISPQVGWDRPRGRGPWTPRSDRPSDHVQQAIDRRPTRPPPSEWCFGRARSETKDDRPYVVVVVVVVPSPPLAAAAPQGPQQREERRGKESGRESEEKRKRRMR